MTSLQAEPEIKSPYTPPSPSGIFEALNRYQQTMALKGAVDLELFTHIARGASTANEIAASCKANERGIRILCDFLTVNGFLQKTGVTYNLTRDSAMFLDRQSPAYLGSIAQFLANPSVLARFQDVAGLVRNGASPNVAVGTASEDDHWFKFATSMTPLMTMTAQIAAQKFVEPGRKSKVLDIACGHGMFGISVARFNPAAEVVAVDWGNVLPVANQNAARAGVQDRFRTLAGDAFEVDLGTGYDLVLIPNFLHHFDDSTIVKLLKKVHGVVSPGGRVATIEFVPNDDRVSPPVAASFSMIMLGATAQGDAYTFREFDRMFRSAGFGESRIQPLEPTPQSLILTSR